MQSLDLFAGTGWGVACQRLGIDEQGVDIMPEAQQSRELNGMTNAYADVWQGLLEDVKLDYDILIASPPCQTFSAAGAGAGRKALDQVLAVIDRGDYEVPELLHELGETLDPRTALVLAPLAQAWRDQPTYIALEQVPPVLPVWEAIGRVLHERLGYSVWTGILNAEQYGVPQTRKRAFLIARLDGKEAAPPKPTHSKFYPRDPKRLDPGVARWVTMAEALEWGASERPSFTLTGGGTGAGGGYEPFGMEARKRFAAAEERGEWVLQSTYSTNSDYQNRGERAIDEPAGTVTSKFNRNQWLYAGAGATAQDTSGQRPREAEEEPAHTVTGTQTAVWFTRPATTLAADARVAGPGRSEFVKGGVSRQNRPGTVSVTVQEAAVLQTYPSDFKFAGTKTKQLLQIGNAVPPLLAQRVLEALIG